jgi:hypothetical protein
MTPASDRRLIRAAVFIIILLAVFPAAARHIDIPSPDELTAKAPIICNGTVVALENTLKKGQAVLPGYPQMTVATEIWKARIKVLSNFKGEVLDEIDLHFSQIDEHPEKTTAICDGPLRISLQLNKRYRFYLKPVPGQKWYVSVLDGDFDDAYAVQPLADIEPDDSPPPVSREEAIKCAANYVKKFKPTADISTIPPEADQWDGKWTVEFWTPPAKPHEYPPTAIIEVVGNRQIERDSWVGDIITTSVADLKASDIGRDFWVYMKPYPKNKKFYTTVTFPPMILHGTIRNVTIQEVEMSDVRQRGTMLTWPTLTVPVEDVNWFQRLTTTESQR